MTNRKSILWIASIACLVVLAASIVVVIVSAFCIDWRVIPRTPVAARTFLGAIFLSSGMAALGGTFFALDRGIATWPRWGIRSRKEMIALSRNDKPVKFWAAVLVVGLAGLAGLAGAIMALACDWMPGAGVGP